MFSALYSVCEENIAFFSGGPKGPQGDAARRLVEALSLIEEHARSLEPVVSGFAAIYHHFDFDPQTPANGYRSLVKVHLRYGGKMHTLTEHIHAHSYMMFSHVLE